MWLANKAKYGPKPDPLTREKDLKDMVAPDEYVKGKLIKILMRQLKGVDDGNFGSIKIENMSDNEKAAFTNALSVQLMQIVNKDMDKEIDSAFIDEFRNWILGKSKFNKDPSTPWGEKRLVGDDFENYLKAFINSKKNYQWKLLELATEIPQTVERAWYYFKYIVCKKEPRDSDYLLEFNFWCDPEAQHPREGVEYPNNPYTNIETWTVTNRDIRRGRDSAVSSGNPGSNVQVYHENKANFDPGECPGKHERISDRGLRPLPDSGGLEVVDEGDVDPLDNESDLETGEATQDDIETIEDAMQDVNNNYPNLIFPFPPPPNYPPPPLPKKTLPSLPPTLPPPPPPPPPAGVISSSSVSSSSSVRNPPPPPQVTVSSVPKHPSPASNLGRVQFVPQRLPSSHPLHPGRGSREPPSSSQASALVTPGPFDPKPFPPFQGQPVSKMMQKQTSPTAVWGGKFTIKSTTPPGGAGAGARVTTQMQTTIDNLTKENADLKQKNTDVLKDLMLERERLAIPQQNINQHALVGKKITNGVDDHVQQNLSMTTHIAKIREENERLVHERDRLTQLMRQKEDLQNRELANIRTNAQVAEKEHDIWADKMRTIEASHRQMQSDMSQLTLQRDNLKREVESLSAANTALTQQMQIYRNQQYPSADVSRQLTAQYEARMKDREIVFEAERQQIRAQLDQRLAQVTENTSRLENELRTMRLQKTIPEEQHTSQIQFLTRRLDNAERERQRLEEEVKQKEGAQVSSTHTTETHTEIGNLKEAERRLRQSERRQNELKKEAVALEKNLAEERGKLSQITSSSGELTGARQQIQLLLSERESLRSELERTFQERMQTEIRQLETNHLRKQEELAQKHLRLTHLVEQQSQDVNELQGEILNSDIVSKQLREENERLKKEIISPKVVSTPSSSPQRLTTTSNAPTQVSPKPKESGPSPGTVEYILAQQYERRERQEKIIEDKKRSVQRQHETRMLNLQYQHKLHTKATEPPPILHHQDAKLPGFTLADRARMFQEAFEEKQRLADEKWNKDWQRHRAEAHRLSNIKKSWNNWLNLPQEKVVLSPPPTSTVPRQYTSPPISISQISPPNPISTPPPSPPPSSSLETSSPASQKRKLNEVQQIVPEVEEKEIKSLKLNPGTKRELTGQYILPTPVVPVAHLEPDTQKMVHDYINPGTRNVVNIIANGYDALEKSGKGEAVNNPSARAFYALKHLMDEVVPEIQTTKTIPVETFQFFEQEVMDTYKQLPSQNPILLVEQMVQEGRQLLEEQIGTNKANPEIVSYFNETFPNLINELTNKGNIGGHVEDLYKKHHVVPFHERPLVKPIPEEEED